MKYWEFLFSKAMECIDCSARTINTAPEWTFGGGTAMMLEYGHRESKDIDIFLHDVQFLASLSPRLNDVAESISISGKYDEQSNYVKIYLDQGEIDFIVAPLLTKTPFTVKEVLGRDVRVETALEIVSKKLFYRSSSFQIRDIYDVGCVLVREPNILLDECGLIAPKFDSLDARILAIRNAYRLQAPKLVINPSDEFSSLLEHGPEVVLDFVSTCRNTLQSGDSCFRPS